VQHPFRLVAPPLPEQHEGPPAGEQDSKAVRAVVRRVRAALDAPAEGDDDGERARCTGAGVTAESEAIAFAGGLAYHRLLRSRTRCGTSASADQLRPAGGARMPAGHDLRRRP
jgi:hypothetical protein